MSPSSKVALFAGTVGGLAASALALQATGTWHATMAEAATVVAVAAAAASVSTLRGAVDRFRSDIRWRRTYLLALSFVIGLASVLATAGLALVASQILRLGSVVQGALIGVAAASAGASVVLDAYSDERAVSDQNQQKLLEDRMVRLLFRAYGQIKIGPQNLEVVLFLKARNLRHPHDAALRIVHTVTVGRPREHPSVLHEERPVVAGEHKGPIWNCYHNKELINQPGLLIKKRNRLLGFNFGGSSTAPLNVWAAPVFNKSNEIVGVLALQVYSEFTSRESSGVVVLQTPVKLAARDISSMVGSDY